MNFRWFLFVLGLMDTPYLLVAFEEGGVGRVEPADSSMKRRTVVYIRLSCFSELHV